MKDSNNMIKALLVKPLETPQKIELQNELSSFKQAVGGYIETARYFNDNTLIVCNEEGKISNLQPNRAIYNESGEMVEIMHGTFLVVGNGDEDFISLTPQETEKYFKLFEHPEKFYTISGRVIVQKTAPIKNSEVQKRNKHNEAKFLLTQKDSFAIYQIKNGDGYNNYFYSSTNELESMGLSIDRDNYNFIYKGNLPKASEPNVILNDLYKTFNTNHPADFMGHSLSVSDIVALKINGKISCHFVDSFGFKEVKDFIEMPQASKYNEPIVGIIEYLGYDSEVIDTVKFIDKDKFNECVQKEKSFGVAIKSREFNTKIENKTPEIPVSTQNIKTPRGTFSITTLTKEEMQSKGYGFHHNSNDGNYAIMGNGTRAFAVKNIKYAVLKIDAEELQAVKDSNIDIQVRKPTEADEYFIKFNEDNKAQIEEIIENLNSNLNIQRL